MTASPSKSTGAIVGLTERFTAERYRVDPHPSARMLRDAAELREPWSAGAMRRGRARWRRWAFGCRCGGALGAASREELLRITAGIGVGESARFLRTQPGLSRRLDRSR
ncbi:hypothetical protein [Kineococcus arenarius]|uniref:hypothetical protein n=1 Tax=Kineococcus sp. SYSU DK007 TaxID=3383128 RepID=UPI003D7C7673